MGPHSGLLEFQKEEELSLSEPPNSFHLIAGYGLLLQIPSREGAGCPFIWTAL
jgi:hypothetical protein